MVKQWTLHAGKVTMLPSESVGNIGLVKEAEYHINFVTKYATRTFDSAQWRQSANVKLWRQPRDSHMLSLHQG